jgi:hypothetical protein
MSIISLGTQDYSIINEDGTSIYYKTSPFTRGELSVNQAVTLDLVDEDQGIVEVIAESLTSSLFAVEIGLNESGQYVEPMSTMPYFENNILFFNSEEHLLDSREEMDAYIDQSENTTMDEYLDLFEENYSGFKSFRTHFIEKYDLINGEFTSEEIESIENEDFLADDINKTILNEYRLVGIADEVIYFHSENQWVKVDKNDQQAINALMALEDYTDLYDPSNGLGDKNRFKIITPLIDSNIEPSPKGEFDLGGGFKFTSTPMIQNISCNVYEKMLKVGVKKCEFDAVYDTWDCNAWFLATMTLTVNWGDGQTSVYNNYTENTWVGHTYASLGTFYVTTILTFSDGQGNNVILEDGSGMAGSSLLFAVSNACTQAELSRWGVQSGGNWKMTTKLWHQDNFFGNKIGSYTHAWKKQANGSYKSRKADIYTGVIGVFRDQDCSYESTKEGNKHHYNDKKIQKTKTKLFKHYDIGNGDVNSLHKLVKDGIHLQESLILNPC